jgi:hypothetical protein
MKKLELEIIGTFSFKKTVIEINFINLMEIDLEDFNKMNGEDMISHLKQDIENSCRDEIIVEEAISAFSGRITFKNNFFDGEFNGELVDCFGKAVIVGNKTNSLIKFTKKYIPEESSPDASVKPLKYTLEYDLYGWHGFWKYINQTGDVDQKIGGKVSCAFNSITE